MDRYRQESPENEKSQGTPPPFSSPFSEADHHTNGTKSTAGEAKDKPPPRPLNGASVIAYSKRQIDWRQNLVGSRFLSRQQGAFWVAPSGHGKSTLAIQTTICWACQRNAFALPVPHPMRILNLQSEDDHNDIIEMASMVDRLSLSPRETDLVDKNSHVEWLNDVTGKKFFEAADDLCAQFKPDILLVNPYSRFTGSEIIDDKANIAFLRDLSILLKKHNCGALLIHHTPKTNYQHTEKYSWYDWMYSMAGGAVLTNWARGVIIMVPSKVSGTYRFICAKRFEKSEWGTREYWFSHSVEDEKFLWVPATQEEISGAQAKQRQADPEALLALIPLLDPISQEELRVLAKNNLHIGRDVTKDLSNILLDKGKIFIHLIPRQGASKFAKRAIGYAKTPPNEDVTDQ